MDWEDWLGTIVWKGWVGKDELGRIGWERFFGKVGLGRIGRKRNENVMRVISSEAENMIRMH